LIVEYLFFIYIAIYGLFGFIIVPHYCSKAMLKFGNSERYWIVIFIVFNFFALLFVLCKGDYRTGLTNKETILFSIFLVSFLLFLCLPVFMLQ
jgi:hypothetical protein